MLLCVIPVWLHFGCASVVCRCACGPDACRPWCLWLPVPVAFRRLSSLSLAVLAWLLRPRVVIMRSGVVMLSRDALSVRSCCGLMRALVLVAPSALRNPGACGPSVPVAFMVCCDAGVDLACFCVSSDVF